jgi:hypothetical protein
MAEWFVRLCREVGYDRAVSLIKDGAPSSRLASGAKTRMVTTER